MLHSILQKKSFVVFSLLLLVAAFVSCPSVRAECCSSCGDGDTTCLCGKHDFCCGKGKCNIFCCNCDGGCRHESGARLCKERCRNQRDHCSSGCDFGCIDANPQCDMFCDAMCETEKDRCEAACNQQQLAFAPEKRAFLKFAKYDKNLDGHLSKEEFAALVKDEAGRFTMDEFDRLDKDKDGRVSLAEADIPMPKDIRKRPAKKQGASVDMSKKRPA